MTVGPGAGPADQLAMPRLNRRSDGGYFVTNSFAKGGFIRHTTYQVEPGALEILVSRGVRSGDEFPKELFFELLEEGELVTGGSGFNDAVDDRARQGERRHENVRDDRRQIPIDVTLDLLNADETFISFGRFLLHYGGSDGYSDDVLRTAYTTLHKRYQDSLAQRMSGLLADHHPISIKREADKVIIELVRC